MDLKITNHKNFFKISGVLNKENMVIFNNEFKDVYERITDLTISVEEVESIDRFGVAALTELYNQSKVNNRSMSVIGFGSKDLYNHFKSQVTAA